jgi:hypothetical protein
VCGRVDYEFSHGKLRVKCIFNPQLADEFNFSTLKYKTGYWTLQTIETRQIWSLSGFLFYKNKEDLI